MHLYRTKSKWKGLIATVLAFAALVCLFAMMLGRTSATSDREQETLLANAIRNAAVSSYATEGRYPATLEAIVAQYGIVIDEKRFIVRYDIFGDNVMPNMSIHSKGENAQ